MSDYSSHLGSGEMSDLNTSGATSDWVTNLQTQGGRNPISKSFIIDKITYSCFKSHERKQDYVFKESLQKNWKI